jgi:hypothetical protein
MFELFGNIAAKCSFGGHDLTCRDALGGAIGFVSDVNLATHLLHDAHMGRFDVAVVISNDSDLLEPIKIVREHLGKKAGILN